MITSKALLLDSKSLHGFRQDLVYVFAVCLFTVHVWSIYNLMKVIPAWLLQFNAWDLLGVIAYTQAFAFVESFAALILLVVLGLTLPGRLFRKKFVTLSTMCVFVTSAWFILAHLNDEVTSSWGFRRFLPWVGPYLITIVLGYVLIHRSTSLEKAILSFVHRLTTLSFVYLFFDIISIFIVIVRFL